VLAWLVARAVGPAPFELSVGAPLEARLWLQPRSQRAVLCLLNEAARQMSPLVQHTVLGPVQVRVRRPCTRVRALVAGQELAVEQGADHICFTLPRLGPYEVLVLEGAA
jgi:hypothetical protein